MERVRRIEETREKTPDDSGDSCGEGTNAGEKTREKMKTKSIQTMQTIVDLLETQNLEDFRQRGAQ